MAAQYISSQASAKRLASPAREAPCVGLSMFGVTTPCVDKVRETLEGGEQVREEGQVCCEVADANWAGRVGLVCAAKAVDCVVFHATGTGGQAMESLVTSGLLSGVIDVTTTEIADYVVGGVMSAGPARMDASIKAGRTSPLPAFLAPRSHVCVCSPL